MIYVIFNESAFLTAPLIASSVQQTTSIWYQDVNFSVRNILGGLLLLIFSHIYLSIKEIKSDVTSRWDASWSERHVKGFVFIFALEASQILRFPNCRCILKDLEKSGHLFWYLEVRGQMFSDISFSQELLWKRCVLHVPEWEFRGRMCTLLAQAEYMSEQGLWICCSWTLVQSRIWLVNHYDCLRSCAGKEAHWEQGFVFSPMLFTLGRNLGSYLSHLGFKAAVLSDTK